MKIKARDILPGDIITKDVEWGSMTLYLKARVRKRVLTPSSKQIMFKCEMTDGKTFTFRTSIDAYHVIERKGL